MHDEICSHCWPLHLATELTQPFSKGLIAVVKEMKRHLTVHEAKVIKWLIVQRLFVLLEL